jgi:large subunit ribosomal protein L10
VALLFSKEAAMPITRAKKEEVVAGLTDRFGSCESAVFVDYRGLSVKDMQALRRDLKGVGGELVVAKNRLIRLALANCGLALQARDGKDLDHLCLGLTAVAFGWDQPSQPAKILLELAGRIQTISLKGGFYGSEPVDGRAGVERIAKMRSKEDALADLVRIISPAAALRPVVTISRGAPARVRTVAGGAIGRLLALKAVLESEQAA